MMKSLSRNKTEVKKREQNNFYREWESDFWAGDPIKREKLGINVRVLLGSSFGTDDGYEETLILEFMIL